MPKNPSPAQRRASRENGRRSHGPTSSEGRQRSARRGTKSGLRAAAADTQALPHEPAERGERGANWHGHYGPGSPASIHMTNQCARLTLLSDRADDYQHAELLKQAKAARAGFRRRQRRRVLFLAGQIRKNPWKTVRQLKAFGTGIEFLIESFENMLVELEQRGYFEPEGVEGAILFFGMAPDDATICRYELAYAIVLNNLGCLMEQPAPDLAKWLEPVNRPLPLRNKPREEIMGADAEACRAVIVKKISEALISLRELHSRVVKEVDEPLLLEELQRASILEEPAARRVARAQADVRVGFHKTWRDLVKDLETGGPPRGSGPDDGEEGNDQGENEDQERDQEQDQDGEAGVTAEAPAEVVNLQDRAAVSTGPDRVPEPACGEGCEFLPFQPEKIVEQSAQLPESATISVEFLAARVQGAKSAPMGDEGGTDGVENGRSEPDFARAAPAMQDGRPPNGSLVPQGLKPRSAIVPGVVHRAPADDDPGGTLIGKDPGGAGAEVRPSDPPE